MSKLVILPGYQDSLGGAVVSPSLTISGFEQCNAAEQLCILVKSNSLMEKYLRQAGQASYMHLLPAQNFMQHALHWVSQQPKDYPLLLENCVDWQMLKILTVAAPTLRLSGRPIYHVFRDQTRSHNRLGNLARKFAFACLSPRAICNSHFTASCVKHLVPKIEAVLYPPIDPQRFHDRSASVPPANLQPILNSGARLMLTPSRITDPKKVNDKNLRSLLPVLAQLKASGHNYHGVVIGEDASPGRVFSHDLLDRARCLGVADCFTILPPTFAIADYYKYADVVVTLAPREPFGRTVVEAIACGTPVIGSNTGGIGEILHHFAPQWAVNPQDSVAAAEAIARLAADLSTPSTLVQGKRWVETYCSAVEYASAMMKITGLNPSALGDRQFALNRSK